MHPVILKHPSQTAEIKGVSIQRLGNECGLWLCPFYPAELLKPVRVAPQNIQEPQLFFTLVLISLSNRALTEVFRKSLFPDNCLIVLVLGG